MKSRRGLSSVVGMVFAIIALTTTVAYVSYSMNTLSQFGQVVVGKSQQSLNAQNEKFQIASASIANNNFNITAVNTGNVPVNFTMMWVTNSSATNMDWTRSYPINNFVGPGASLHNIGQGLPISVSPVNSYNVKLVTSRGNSYQLSVNSANQSPLLLQLIATPNTVPTGFQTTVLLVVTNNATNNAVLTNVTPNALSSISNSGVTSICSTSSTPPSYSTIQVGATVIFQWTCTETGGTGAAITYNATLQNGYNHNYALTTVTIGSVQFAEQSSNSLTSAGLSVAGQASDQILLFDQNQFNVPNGGYQMYDTQADNGTNKILQIDTTSPSFYTNNGTSTVNINPGKWNATLRYISAPVPSTLMNNLPDMVFHFEDYESGKHWVGDSMGDEGNLTMSGTTTAPVCGSGGGVNGSCAYTFGSQYTSQNVDQYSDTNNNQVTTTMWFKTSGSVSGTAALVRMGDQSNHPFYEIAVSNHKMLFQFTNEGGGSPPIDAACTGFKTVDDQNWHHVVAEKTSQNGCQLYVDGNTDGSQTIKDNSACTWGQHGTCTNVSGHWNIGRDPSSGSNSFSGTIDDFIHWNSYQLTSSQVTDLFKTSYGTNAEKVTFAINIVDQHGNFISNVVTSTSYNLSFMDAWWSNNCNPTYTCNNLSGGLDIGNSHNSVWGHYNYTTTLTQTSVPAEDRLELVMTFVPPTNGKLGMKMIIDNTALTDSWGQSLLEVPSLSSGGFLGYYSYDNQDDGSVYVSNAGPYQAWVTSNSRVIFSTPDLSQAYAAWINFGCASGHGNNCNSIAAIDSIIVPVNTNVQMTFSVPDSQPGLDSVSRVNGATIPVGTYKMWVFINGYDQEGNVILGTQYFGEVTVYSR